MVNETVIDQDAIRGADVDEIVGRPSHFGIEKLEGVPGTRHSDSVVETVLSVEDETVNSKEGMVDREDAPQCGHDGGAGDASGSQRNRGSAGARSHGQNALGVDAGCDRDHVARLRHIESVLNVAKGRCVCSYSDPTRCNEPFTRLRGARRACNDDCGYETHVYLSRHSETPR